MITWKQTTDAGSGSASEEGGWGLRRHGCDILTLVFQLTDQRQAPAAATTTAATTTRDGREGEQEAGGVFELS